ncbi:hypothetical protein OS493_014448 [Desmophyllum pertusum]|uniref:Uncharacterized protein n=1 Tax=Desmophyllum pertusum TaxID=174260 RepID=A0A9X0CKH3_9CNID|nr:hypothetical protein OS493_014448 [Desmophyllum pertusum]
MVEKAEVPRTPCPPPHKEDSDGLSPTPHGRLSDSLAHPTRKTQMPCLPPHKEDSDPCPPSCKEDSYLVFGHAPVPGSSLPSLQSQKSSLTDVQLIVIFHLSK